MNAPTAAAITSIELHKLLESSPAPRLVDVRTPGEFETAHITGSHNVPLDVLDKHGPEIARRLDQDRDVVLVCRSGQRSAKAAELLRAEGLTSGRVLENGLIDWEGRGFAGRPRRTTVRILQLRRGVRRRDNPGSTRLKPCLL